MRGAPWQGLFYAFVLEAIVALGAFVYALNEDDFLGRAIGWAVFGLAALGAVRTIRAAARQGDAPDRPTGRWWFGG